MGVIQSGMCLLFYLIVCFVLWSLFFLVILIFMVNTYCLNLLAIILTNIYDGLLDLTTAHPMKIH